MWLSIDDIKIYDLILSRNILDVVQEKRRITIKYHNKYKNDSFNITNLSELS